MKGLELPAQVSADGREIWDWAKRLSRITGLRQRARDLNSDIRKAQGTCGSCSLWMTPRCPHEVHDNRAGRSRGPHADAPVCGEFRIRANVAAWIEQRKAERAEVERLLSSSSEDVNT